MKTTHLVIIDQQIEYIIEKTVEGEKKIYTLLFASNDIWAPEIRGTEIMSLTLDHSKNTVDLSRITELNTDDIWYLSLILALHNQKSNNRFRIIDDQL